MFCQRRMEKISWTDRVRNDELQHRVEDNRNVIYTLKRRKANWLGHILCYGRKERKWNRSNGKTRKKT